ncbi:MAG: hypothetical protein EXQ74_04620 [Thermoleophilia bacterium]|nr:hypothetical protein [Thermoleophilia bacterium]
MPVVPLPALTGRARESGSSRSHGLIGEIRLVLDDLAAIVTSHNAQGPQVYAAQMLLDHPALDEAQVLADAILTVEAFHTGLSPERGSATAI